MGSLRWQEVAGPGAVLHVARHRATEVTRLIHSHDFAELFWVESGTAYHCTTAGTCPLQSGDVVMVAPSDNHHFGRPSADFAITNVAFPYRELNGFRHRYFPQSNFPWDGDPPRRYRLGSGLSRRLLPSSVLPDPTSRLELDRLLTEVLSAISDSTVAAFPSWLVAAVEEWRRDPGAMMRGVAGLAEVACRSRGHVSRVVRQSTGDTATALVNRLRLEEAAARLALTDAPIAAVAADVGFNSLSHFYRLFGDSYGTTPARYRRP